MSALTNLFTAMANKIRTKTGTQTTYTPSEMVSDGIDDVFDAGVESATTPITPYNREPAEMLANTGYKPTTDGYAVENYFYVRPNNVNPYSVQTDDVCVIASHGLFVESIVNVTPSNSSPVEFDTDWIIKPTTIGYAIESYDSVTPSSTPTSVASGDIVKIGGSGVIVDAIPTPTSITPSNSSPVAMSANTVYKPTTNGVAIEQIDKNINPSSTPVSISNGEIIKAYGSGVVVDAVPTPTNLTPSNSSPANITSGEIYQATASGKAVASIASVTPSDSSPVSVSSGDILSPTASGYLYATQQGSGTEVKTGTLTTSAANTDYTINTGLSAIHEFWLHGYATGSDAYKMQHNVYYNANDAGYYQTGTHLMPESNVGCSGREAIGTVYNRRGYSIKSISGGTVVITTPSVNTTFASSNMNWTAY